MAPGEPTDSGPTEESLQESAERVKHLSAEVDRQRSGHTQRAVAMNTKAALLVTAAGVFAGLGSATKETWVNAPLYALLVFAAAMGLWALWPKAGPDVNVGALRDDLNSLENEQLALILLDLKLHAHDHDEKSLMRTSKLVTCGFAVLTLAVLAVAIRAVI